MAEAKPSIICPRCGNIAKLIPNSEQTRAIYLCESCKLSSNSELCVDIKYNNGISSPLSNLFPHKFSLRNVHIESHISTPVSICLSMESFLQGLKIKNKEHQMWFMSNYTSMDACRMSETLSDWKKDQILYFNGVPYHRESDAYISLITRAYDALFETNAIYRELVLPHFKGKYLIHSIGKDDKTDTVLTETEFRFQLNRLMKKL